MNKVWIFLSIFFLCKYTNAQYVIPFASQQPAWVFPIWIEDAYGIKDTVYFGFDTTATNTIDAQFGEGLMVEDSINMQAWLSLYTFPGVPDSITKVDVRNTLEFAFDLNMPEAVKITEKYNRVRFGEKNLSNDEADEIENWLQSLDKEA